MSNVEFDLKKEAFMDELKKKQWSIEKFATEVSISFVTVYRVLNGERKPGNRFIASTLAAFNSSDITQFFLINLLPIGDKDRKEGDG